MPGASSESMAALARGQWPTCAVRAANTAIDPSFLNESTPIMVNGVLSVLPANASGAPITYLAGGRQYVAFPVGGSNVTGELIALALP